ncbi:tail fiber protein [uncultured phage_MedDCM-OCT-S28-C10]|uniref:Tail fiber protein n=1 Tax=uncultured phage_MedDCM-OCT-S28-C10 TaxID=2741077 RepID=A0A6S4P7Q0_9CAUD|nr:tail fiber protein [uncultured phage_MedDCM-OCT-S28-C10]BAQ94051.1 tail fiber protein [uncultured phage_MedDCM-OCT-S28-C10]
MANSYVQYTGNGSLTAFNITFDFIDASHLTCTVNGVNTSYTLSSGNTVATLASAPANGAAIEFKRTSSQASRLTDYVAGSVLKESDLDTDSKQGFFMGQEAIDNAANTIQQDNSDFNWNANNKKIKNVTDPSAAQHAATKNYVDTGVSSQVVAATTQATNAANSATAAATSATNAATSASTASSQATNSSNSASTSTTKASEASTSATAAASSATTASGHATTATTKASEASTSATNAASSATTALTQATNSANSATAAASSAAAAAASADNFDDTYLGAKASDPSVDNDGDALSEGDLYFNTTTDQIKFYNGSSWTGIGVNTDETFKVSSNDTTSGYLGAKLTATGSTGLTLTETNNGSNETLNATLASVPNASLANSSITINGSAVALGGSVSVGETKPTIGSISPSTITNAQTAVTITGTNFVTCPQVEALNPSTGIWYVADSVSFTNATTIVATFTLTVDATYKLRVENPDGLSVLSSSNILTVSDAPTFSTDAGSLGELAAGGSTAFAVAGSSDSTVAYSKTSGALPSGYSLNTSTGAITGTENAATQETIYNFTITLTDAEAQTSSRAFSITVTVGMNNSGQWNP